MKQMARAVVSDTRSSRLFDWAARRAVDCGAAAGIRGRGSSGCERQDAAAASSEQIQSGGSDDTGPATIAVTRPSRIWLSAAAGRPADRSQ
jgi:hypothetical protein